jgi:hypothetical protein
MTLDLLDRGVLESAVLDGLVAHMLARVECSLQ